MFITPHRNETFAPPLSTRSDSNEDTWEDLETDFDTTVPRRLEHVNRFPKVVDVGTHFIWTVL